jgi:hypothetical protein
MPKAEHDKLARQADKLGLTGDRRRAYIYGTMDKIAKARQRKAAGRPSSGR